MSIVRAYRHEIKPQVASSALRDGYFTSPPNSSRIAASTIVAGSSTSMRRRDFLRLAAAGGALAAAPARAQNAWPAHTARFIVPFAAGGAIDIPARLIADRLGRDLSASFIVENRTGAGGAIGAQAVVQWPPDGSGFLFTSSSVASLPALRANLGFDPLRDLQPLSLVCDVPTAMLVAAKSRFASVPQVIAEARANPGKLTYGSGGVGSSNHLAGASFASTAGIDLLHVPYRGASQVLNAIYAGQIDMMFAPTLEALGYVQQRAVRALGVATAQRIAALPDVPAIIEFVPGYTVSNWFAMFAPARLPDDLRTRFVAALAALRDWPDLQARLAAGAAVLRLDGPDPLAKRLAEDTAHWAVLIKKLGIKAE
jgi:tripartite-type tricarboxylate transporter receptor subunit TctC